MGSVLPDILQLLAFGAVPLCGSNGVSLAVATTRCMTCRVTDKSLQDTCHTTRVFHDCHVQLNEGSGDRRAMGHCQHTVGTVAEGLVEEGCELRDFHVGIDGERGNKGYAGSSEVVNGSLQYHYQPFQLPSAWRYCR